MPARAADGVKSIRTYALSLPGTQPKSPWPGHDDVAVHDKTFLYLSVDEGSLSIGVKLRVSREDVLRLSHAAPMGYGLGKSGWVRITFAADMELPVDTAKRWVWESYRAQAPKRLVKELEAAQPWVASGELPIAQNETQ